MNKLLLMLILIGCFKFTNAQQKPYYTQYIINNYILNPALSGVENYTDVKLSYRNQWTGIDGAPVTMYCTIQGPLDKTDDKTNINSYSPMDGQNPRGKEYWEDYTTSAPHSGIGFQLINDQAGYISQTSANATYAYHLPLDSKKTLAFGFLAGINNISLDRSKIDWATEDPNDPAIGYTDGELKKFSPQFGAGLWLYTPDYYLGASVLNIIPGKATFVQGNTTYGSTFLPQYFLTGGYRFSMGDDMNMVPSALIQMSPALPIEVDLNAKFQYEDMVWFGGSYRISDQLGGFAIMAGLSLSKVINVSYSYDLSVSSELEAYTQSTNEIVIGFLLNNKYGDTCPRNIW